MNSEPLIAILNGTTGLWGGERSMEDLTKSMALSGSRIDVLVRDPAVGQVFDGLGNINVRLVRALRGPRLRNLCFIGPILKLPEASVLLVFDLRLIPIAIALLPILRRRSITLVIDIHDVPLETQRLFQCIKLARRADGCICVSSYAAKQVVEYTSTFVVKRGVSTSEVAPFVERPDAGRPLRIGIIGRLDKEKELEIGVRAVALASVEVDVQLILRGAATYDKSGYGEQVLSEAIDLLGSKFRFEGTVNHEEVLRDIDVLLFCATREPSGRIVAEAQAAGVPVLVPSHGGVAEFVQDGKTGLVYDQRSATDAAAKLVLLARDEHLRRQLATNAQSVAAVDYEPLKQARKYLDAIQEIQRSKRIA